MLHRLTVPSYHGGLPAGYDYINNATSGTPAPVSAQQSGGTYDGTYLQVPQEAAEATRVNRANAAIAENTDYLDDVVRTSRPTPAWADFTAGASETSKVITDDVFVGKVGTTDTQQERDRLIVVVDAATLAEVVDASGTRVVVSAIEDGASSNVVGQEAAGYRTNPTVLFNVAVPNGLNYRLVYLQRGHVVGESDPSSNGFMGDVVGQALARAGRQTAATTLGEALTGARFNLTGGTVGGQLKQILDQLTFAGDHIFSSDSAAITFSGTSGTHITGPAGGGLEIMAGQFGTRFRGAGAVLLAELGLTTGAEFWQGGAKKVSVDSAGLNIDALTSPAIDVTANNNNSFTIARSIQSGTGTTTAAAVAYQAQQGRAVVSGNNNDGGAVSLHPGAVGTGGTAPTATAERGQHGSLRVRWGGSPDLQRQEWFFKVPSAAGTNVVLINLASHGFVVQAGADSVVLVRVACLLLSTAGTNYGLESVERLVRYDASLGSNNFEGVGTQTPISNSASGIGVLVTDIQPSASTTGPTINVEHSAGDVGHLGVYVEVISMKDIAL